MFSPDLQTTPAPASTRNPRRRQRGENDSVGVKQPVRKRSKLSQETFAPANGVNGVDGSDGRSGTRMNGHAKSADSEGRSSLNLAVREKSNGILGGSKRGNRPDTSTVFTRTPSYTFKQLPAFPERLKGGDAEDFQILTQPGSNYALALTRTQALIWDHTASFANPTTRVFTFPQAYKANDPLPLGTLVTSNSSTDLGLVLVGAKDGKVTFWENVEFADSVALFHQRQQGAEGHIKLLGGESAVELLDAQHAGYLVRLSSGRVVHFSTRDQQGRPNVTVQLLRGEVSNGWGIGNLFKGSWQKRDLAAVKARPASRKSYVDVTAITRDATITEWDISWEGQQTTRREMNVKATLRAALQNEEAVYLQQDESVHVLDFVHLKAPLARGDELVSQSVGETVSLLLCVAIQSSSQVRFAMVELLLLESAVAEGAVFPIHAYKSTTPRHADELQAKILLSDPGHTALLITDEQLLVVGVSPDAEHRFEDALLRKQGPAYKVIGSSIEASKNRQGTAHCLLATKSAGLTRVSLEEGGTQDRLSPRIKFEQAIYFGHIPETFLRLAARPAFRYSDEEVEQALVHVSHAILDSSCEYVPPVAQSALDQIEFRSRRLRDLSHFIAHNYPDIPREVKWRVFWDAEKVNAVHEIWRAYERLLATAKPEQPPLLQAVLERAHQKGRIRPDTKIETKELLRQWFVTDGRSVEKVVQWTYDGLHDIFKEQTYNNRDLLSYISQADEIAILTLGSAFKFRQEHAADFGLGEEKLERGLLLSGYQGLPQFWTSSLNVVNGIRQLTDFSRAMATYISNEDDVDEHVETVAKSVAQENVDLVDLTCRAHIERTMWLRYYGDDEAAIKAGEKWKTEFERDIRPTLITGLAKLGQAAAGMTLAERFGDLDSLVELSLDELRYYDPEGEETSDLSPDEKQDATQRFVELKSQVKQYFEKYGTKWANAFYDKAIEQEMYAEILDKEYGPKAALTKYLRENPSRAKVAWINDIGNGDDLAAGAQSLFSAATAAEPNAWCQNIELSLAKLTSLAIGAKKEAVFGGDVKRAARHERLVDDIDRSLALSRLQQRLYNHVKRTSFLAVGQEEAADLLVATYGSGFEGTTEQPALGELLKQGFEELVHHHVMSPALLIDVLTLMDSISCDAESDDISGKECLMALQVLNASGLANDESKKAQFENLARLIWKRCFVRDDWIEVVKAAEGSTDKEITALLGETAAFKTLKEGNLLALWSTSPAFQPLAPSVALNACSTIDELSPRFAEDLAASIAADNAHDDAILQLYITDAKLDDWFTSLLKLAKQAAIDDSPAMRDVTARRELLEFVKHGYKEPDFTPVAEVRSLRGMATGKVSGLNGFEDFEDDDGQGEFEDQDEGYEEGYEGEEEGDVDGIDADGDVEMG